MDIFSTYAILCSIYGILSAYNTYTEYNTNLNSFQTWEGMNGHEKDICILFVICIANLKVMISLLLLVVAIFSKQKDHILRGSVSMAIYVSLCAYYITVSPVLTEMERSMMVTKYTSSDCDGCISILIVVWIFIYIWEISHHKNCNKTMDVSQGVYSVPRHKRSFSI